ncbi:MAG: C39 family peptidase [Anaerolineales bacterium]
MRKKIIWRIIVALLVCGGVFLILFQLPAFNRRVIWRWEIMRAYAWGVLHPVEAAPTPLPPPAVYITRVATPIKSISSDIAHLDGTPTPTATLAPIPSALVLPAPAWEKQDINNCGPAALTMYLRYWGWQGDQYAISNLVKPQRDDRNVNVEELVYYVRTQVGWLDTEYRVGGDLDLLKLLLANGFPVMIEESFYFDTPFYPNDDLWAAHYNLITGYDDKEGVFITQDSYHGANLKMTYPQIAQYWQPFNYVYLLLFPPEKKNEIMAILGADWDEVQNRQNALGLAKTQSEENPQDAFAWFNIGTNQVYFENYVDAALAYDQARKIGLPQRMYRYQFGPFFAYFHSGRIDDLLALAEYALKRTPNSEEALMWRGWAYYRQRKINLAVADFRSALEQNPNDQDAQYALNFVLNNP